MSTPDVPPGPSMDSDGATVDENALIMASNLLDALCDDRQPPPTVVSATLEGVVRLEWHMTLRVTSIDCETDGSIEFVSTRKGEPSLMMDFSSVLDCLGQLNDTAGVFDAG